MADKKRREEDAVNDVGAVVIDTGRVEFCSFRPSTDLSASAEVGKPDEKTNVRPWGRVMPEFQQVQNFV